MSNRRGSHNTTPCALNLVSSAALHRQKLNFLQPPVVQIYNSTVTIGWGEESQTYDKCEKREKKSHFPRKTDRKEIINTADT